MAILSVTVPDAIAVRVLNAVAYYNGYTDMVWDMDGNQSPNPVTKAQFAKDVIKIFIKNVVVAYEAMKAAEDARQAATDAANSQITIGD
jgi:hypothetical protein